MSFDLNILDETPISFLAQTGYILDDSKACKPYPTLKLDSEQIPKHCLLDTKSRDLFESECFELSILNEASSFSINVLICLLYIITTKANEKKAMINVYKRF